MAECPHSRTPISCMCVRNRADRTAVNGATHAMTCRRTRDDMPTGGLSAIVVTHNSQHAIGDCLRSVSRQFYDAELVVIDNASTDETVTLSQAVANTTVVRNHANVGFGRACNQGAEIARGSHLMFLNPDVVLISADHRKLQSELAQVRFGLQGPLFQQGSRIAPMLLADRSWPLDALTHALGPLRPRELPALPKVRLRPTKLWPAGAALLCSRTEFLEVGGFNPDFFLYYEDRDLARRYRAAELPVGSTDSIIAVHRAGTSSTGDDPMRTVANGWAYLGWIEYVSIWHGETSARRAAASADWLRSSADWLLELLTVGEALSRRAKRKRLELRRVADFVRSQPFDGGFGIEREFCPRARKILAERAG
jgi:N-acetylglucosaminyl-diphospho-decaprenol L-rhamnosyltransferase